MVVSWADIAGQCDRNKGQDRKESRHLCRNVRLKFKEKNSAWLLRRRMVSELQERKLERSRACSSVRKWVKGAKRNVDVSLRDDMEQIGIRSEIVDEQ